MGETMMRFALDRMLCLTHEAKQDIYDLLTAQPNSETYGDPDGYHVVYVSSAAGRWLAAEMDGNGNIDVGLLDADQLDVLKRDVSIDEEYRDRGGAA